MDSNLASNQFATSAIASATTPTAVVNAIAQGLTYVWACSRRFPFSHEAPHLNNSNRRLAFRLLFVFDCCSYSFIANSKCIISILSKLQIIQIQCKR